MLWKYTTLSANLDKFTRQYHKFNGKEVYILGFSIGAVVAFIASTKIKTKAVILCSLSPIFKEDLPRLKKSWKKLIGGRRLEDYRKYSFNQFARKSRCKTILVAGSDEVPLLLKRVKDATKKLKNSKLILIKGVKHNIAQEEYLNALKKIISKI